MITIKTKAYGEIELSEDSLIHFKKGILGFEDYHDYYLLEMKDLPHFYWLQSGEEKNLAFVVVNPRLFIQDYDLNIDEADKSALELTEESEILDFAIVNIPDDPSKMTLNLLGPLVVNVSNRIGLQAISMSDQYGTKHPVFQPVEEKSSIPAGTEGELS